MVSKGSWKTDYSGELAHARLARSEGNEGMARVCARRAAGIVVGEYLQRHGYTILTNSAYDRLTQFIEQPEINDRCKEICKHFLIRVNPEHKLPDEADLIQDVIWLQQSLLNEVEN